MSARSDKQILVKELAEIWFSHIENIMRPSSYARYHYAVLAQVMALHSFYLQ